MDRSTAEFYLGTGFNLLITYGATETNIPTLGNRGRRLTADSCSQPYPDVSVKISESGELLIRSPHMMKGYFRDPELTEQAFEDGWFKTGDLCQCNAQGNYVIVGRCKENIVLSTGKKVIPEDVEKAYAGLAGIKELVVCGVPVASRSYDDVHAFVVRQDQTVSTNRVLQALHNKGAALPPQMKIIKVHFVDDIPKTSLQKPKRYLLKKIALDESSRLAEEKILVDQPEQDNIENEMIYMIAEAGQFERRVLSKDSKPFSGLGMDSLSSIELALQIESRYGIRVDHAFNQNMTIADMADLIRTPGDHTTSYGASADYPKKKKLGDYNLFRYFCNLARFFYKVTVSNDKVIPEDSGFILCANHVSNFDYLWLTMNFKRKRFEKFCCMAKQEILDKSHASKVLSQICGMIPVDRANAQVETMVCCQRQLKEQWGLLIHPEGTRSVDGELGIFKKGAVVLAIETNVPIIPAYIHGVYDVYPKGHKLPNLFNFRRMRKYAVAVVYGNPIFPSGKTADELILQVKDAILALKGSLTDR